MILELKLYAHTGSAYPNHDKREGKVVPNVKAVGSLEVFASIVFQGKFYRCLQLLFWNSMELW